MKIRKGTWETNSSSTHSIAISKEKVQIPKGTTIKFHIGEYGWEEEEYSFPDYLYTTLICSDNNEAIKRLEVILDDWGVNYEFQIPVYHYYGDKNQFKYVDNGYVDHYEDAEKIMLEILDKPDLLARALFGDAIVYTGNDNSSEEDSMCFCAWKRHPNHNSKKYDYFFKGN